MKRIIHQFALCMCLLFTSCIIRSPKFASADQAFAVKTGMTKEQVNTTLGIPPYALKSKNDSETVFIYKYRPAERRTMPLFMGRTNGKRATGPLMDLNVSYDKHDLVTELKSKPSPKEEKSQYTIDVNSIFTLLTVTAPALLVYLGFQHK
ncbi:MAG TPA: outer membrane protein assembly factor BamE [Bacteroidia bacterium]|nr:outer membrane protein assembly factor BamE [Bacteroidia bacterium]